VIADKFNVLQMGMIAGERVFKVLDNNDVLPLTDGERKRFEGDIQFEHVGFGYQEGVPVLKDISFHIKQGQTMAIVGNTGSGKSTLVNLLNRMYPISSGKILIDGISVEDMEISALRKQIAVVLQDVFLFSGSVIDNITLRNDSIDREKVIEASKMIGIHDFIMNLPGGYDFNVMERGGLLSLATSSVDTESEELIQNAIQKISSGRTSIVIAHRLSTIKKADIIMVLDKGNIVEFGTHEELLAQKAAYFELYQKQFILPL
jgi:ATP-binding cassette subfamily B protein